MQILGTITDGTVSMARPQPMSAAISASAPGRDVQGRGQRCRAVTDVVVCLAGWDAGTHRQERPRPVQGLDVPSHDQNEKHPAIARMAAVAKASTRTVDAAEHAAEGTSRWNARPTRIHHQSDQLLARSRWVTARSPHWFWRTTDDVVAGCNTSAAQASARQSKGYRVGNVKENVLPPPARFCAHIRPPCPSMMHLETYSPSPTPRRSSFVS
jgi:hypothetical protein